MASIIRIKRSDSVGNPATLATGELAYSALAGTQSNGGDRLYFGQGVETGGNAANHLVIGGKYFTDMLDHVAGTLTNNSALIVDNNGKLDILNVDNITLNGNTISTTDTNGNLILSPNGSGLISIAGAYTLPRVDGIAGYVLTTNGSGTVSWQPSAASLVISSDSGSDSISLLTDTLTFAGGEGIDTAINTSTNTLTISAELASSSNLGVASFTSTDFTVTSGNVVLATVNSNVGTYGSAAAVPVITVDAKGRITAVSTASISTSFTISSDSGSSTFNNGGTLTFTGTDPVQTSISGSTITFSVDDATTTSKGIASFNSATFSVAAGAVSVKAGGISNSQLVYSNVTVGSTSIALGSTSTTLAGLTNVTIGNLNITNNTISSTNSNGNIILDPNGSGTVDVSGAKITGLGTPTADTDAVTKVYVDNVAQGLNAHEPVLAATTATLASISGGAVTYSTATGNAVLMLANPITVLDGYTLNAGDRVLIKNETSTANNGAYVYTSATWFTRAVDFNEPIEIGGGDFFFVQNGSVNANTGWIETTKAAVVGTDPIVFVQFSGAGTYSAGAGLSLNGTLFSVNTSTSGGIQIISNAVQLASSVAGDGLTYSSGILNVVGTSGRISVSANAVDIDAGYAGQTSITTLGTITTGTWHGNVIDSAYGGTGFSSYLQGSLLVGGAANTLTTVTIGTNGFVLTSNGTSPVWSSASGLTAGYATTATNLANGTAGDIPYQNAAGQTFFLPIGAAGKVLQVSTSTGYAVWGDIDGGTY